MRNFWKKYWFLIIVIFAILIKYLLTINLPINIRDNCGADEYLMLTQAEALIKGEYLGNYNYLTLVKGIGFPLFLTLAFKIGLSYLSLYSLFYSGVCLIALIPISKIIKNKFLIVILFLMLLFCPATLDSNVQLMYRNMLTIPQSVLLISCIMMMYFKMESNRKYKLTFWALMSGFSWVFLWHTREDSIWSFPLMLIALFVFILYIVKYLKTSKKVKFGKLFIVFIPFFMLFASNRIISFVNYKNYGIYTTNQLNDSNYQKAVMLMMKIKPEEEIEHVTITRNTLLKLYNISPTFAELKEIIEYDYNNKGPLVMAEEDNGEINEDLITWELTGAANSLGYYETAQKAEKFWGKVYDEIKIAIDNKKIETRKIIPSRSLIPFPKGTKNITKLLKSIGSLYLHAAKYDYSYVELYKSKYDEKLNRRYETISGSYSIREDINKITISGVLSSQKISNNVSTKIEDNNGNIIKTINCDFRSSQTCDIQTDFEIPNSLTNNIYLIIRNKNQEIIYSYNLIKPEDNLENSNYIINALDIETKLEEDAMVGRANRYIRIVKKIINIYSLLGAPLLYISLFYYTFLTIILIYKLIKKKKIFFEKWLFLSALLGSITVILIGLGYVNAFMVNVNGYLSACNGLLNLFMWLSILLLIEDMFNLLKRMCIKYTKCRNKNIQDIAKILLEKDFNALFNAKTNNTFIQFFRYIFVGGFAAIVNIGMLYVFTDICSIYYILSNILSFILGLIVNYVLSKKMVFQEKVEIKKEKEFLIYTIIGLIGLGLDILLIVGLTNFLSIYYMLSKIISTIIVFIWNFSARKIFYKLIK